MGEISKCKYFFATVLACLLLCSVACTTVVGAYSDDPYGPVVDCDSKIPMDELIQCVKDQYEMMDKIHVNEKVWKRKAYYDMSQVSNYKNTANIKYSEIKEFIPLKKADNYTLTTNSSFPVRLRTDEYEDVKMAISQREDAENIEYYLSASQISKMWYGLYISTIPVCFSHHHLYFRNYWAASRDILVTKENGRNKVFSVGYEIVPLKNNKALYVISVALACQPTYTNKQIAKAMKTHSLPPDYKEYFGQYKNGIQEALSKKLKNCGQ